MGKIAILIKTYERPDRIEKCVQKIESYCDVPYTLCIGDDGIINPQTEALYQRLEEEGHTIVRYDEYMPVTRARNDLIRRVEEDFVLRMDDDFMFSERTSVARMLDVMRAVPAIGAIADIERQLGDGKGLRSGELSSRQGYITKAEECFLKICVPVTQWNWRRVGDRRYAIVDHSRNFLLIRREVFSSVKWDENLFLDGEHEAFMLDMQATGWLLAFTPDSEHVHDESFSLKSSPKYSEKRKGLESNDSMSRVFWEKYGVRCMQYVYLADVPTGNRFGALRRAVRKTRKVLNRLLVLRNRVL